MTPTAAESKELVQRHVETMKTQDWDACAETLADDIVMHQAGETHHGVAWYIDHLQRFRETFPDVTITIDELFAEETRVAVRITNTGTYDGGIPGADSTTDEITFSSHLIFRVADGAIVELWVVAEQLRLMQQLGVVDPPGG